jgi:hypothetical protein
VFDFPRWRKWLEPKAAELKVEGLETRFAAGPDDGPKPGMTLGIAGRRAIGDFSNWITGETDYTIAAPPSPKARMVCHKWGVIVTDDTFEPLFAEFLAHFRRYESGQGNP